MPSTSFTARPPGPASLSPYPDKRQRQQRRAGLGAGQDRLAIPALSAAVWTRWVDLGPSDALAPGPRPPGGGHAGRRKSIRRRAGAGPDARAGRRPVPGEQPRAAPVGLASATPGRNRAAWRGWEAQRAGLSRSRGLKPGSGISARGSPPAGPRPPWLLLPRRRQRGRSTSSPASPVAMVFTGRNEKVWPPSGGASPPATLP